MMCTDSLRILVVDDHPLTRAGIVQVISREFPNGWCREVATLQAAKECLEEQAWDLVLMDQNLPDGKGIEFLASHPGLSTVMILTMYEDRELCLQAQHAGACGFVSKGDDPRTIVDAIRKVIGGGRHFPHSKAKGDDISLSQRERELLRHLLAGQRAADIAREWQVSQTTVQSYRNRLFQKFGVDSLADLVRDAVGRGLA
jgi:DNA-binding NarL/FixJ family response regulator